MWQHVFEYSLPALVGAGLVGLIFGLTKQRSVAWLLLMVLMVVLIAAGAQVVWEFFAQLRHGWQHFFVLVGVAFAIALPFSFFMQKFRKKDGHDV